MWRKLELEPQHEHFASLRERYWQNVLLRMHDGLYTVRFSHVDFEVQICLGQPPPPKVAATCPVLKNAPSGTLCATR